MKHFYTFLVILLAGHFGFGQTEILNESLTLGSIPSGWTQVDVSFQTSAGGYARFDSTSADLTSETFDASAYTSIEVNFDIAKFGSGGDGPLSLEYSTNNGTSWTFISNSVTPTGSTYLSNNIVITDLSSTMKIRFLRTPSPSQKRLRNVIINGFGIASTNDTDSFISAASFNASENIDYTLYPSQVTLTTTNALKIGEFTIQDLGTSDTEPTTLTDIVFSVLGFDNIAEMAIFDNTTAINVSQINTVTGTATFSGLSLQAADGSDKTFSIYVTFKSTVTDNEQLQFTISSATADPSSSVFSTIDAGSAQTSIVGDDNRIEVTATDLLFDTNTSNVELNAMMTPAPTIIAVDSNVNVDLDPITITLTPSVATIYSITTSFVETTIAGTATFDNLKFDTLGSGYTLTASSSTLNTDTSSAFDVTEAVVPSGAIDLFFSEYVEGSGNNKYLEIYNGTGADVTLTDYTVQLYANGSTSPNNTEDFTGAGFPALLTDGSTIVLKNSAATIFTGTAFSSSVCGFNGDDALVLRKNGVIIDIIGNIGCDPGARWIGGSNDTLDETLVRDSDVCGGVTTNPTGCSTSTFLTLESEWTTSAIDDVSNLGTHTANCSVAPPSCNTFAGNGLTGFGGTLGTGSLEVCAISGTTIDFTFTRGSGDFNDFMVIYIDSQAGGISSTINLTDAGDDGRKAVSGFDGGNRSTVDFPPGFQPDFAISLNNGFAGLFEIVEFGAHNFIQSASLSPTGINSSATYTFNIDFANINTTPSAGSLKLLATYLNPNGAFRSNESVGRHTAVGNPGANLIDFETYFQVYSGLQGGKAPSVADGLWTDGANWLNGNAPLATDEIIINNAINQNTDFSSGSIEITGTNTLTTIAGSTLALTGGITGTGNLNINGKLIITEGGFTTITPTYGSGSTLEYRNILATYNRFNEWSNASVLGVGVPDNVIIENATLDLTNGAQPSFQDFTVASNVSLLTNGSMTLDANESLLVGGDFSNTFGNLDLNSTSTTYSSLIVNGSSSGDVIYRRHVNTFNNTIGSTTGNNDLIAAPVTNSSQTFSAFRAANSNIPSGTIGGVPSFLFGPFDNDTNAYVNYNASNDNEVLIAGIGYRSASTNTSTFTFVGDVETNPVSVPINVGALSQWNLIGNPYTSYLSMNAFLVENNAAFNTSSSGIYGYDGDASDGFIVRNLAYFVINPDEFITPGQGFLVTSAPSGATVNFTPSMRENTSSDDFILGRQGISENAFITLEISKSNAMYSTSLFFLTENVSLGLDPGYDTSVFGNVAPDDFAIFSHLIENNEGIDLAIQSLPSSSLSTVIVPLGVNVNAGEQFTIRIETSSLPSYIDVYLDDTLNNTSTLLNQTDYVLTAPLDIKDTGRYFLRLTDNSLSTPENSLNVLDLYVSKTDKKLVVNGQFDSDTVVYLYDIQGRLITTHKLDHSLSQNQIDISSVHTGVYIVSLKNNALEYSQKVVIY